MKCTYCEQNITSIEDVSTMHTKCRAELIDFLQITIAELTNAVNRLHDAQLEIERLKLENYQIKLLKRTKIYH